MKKILSIFLFLFLSYHIHAQFAKIIDKDGYVNLRKEEGIKSQVTGRIQSGEIVYVYDQDEKNKDWLITDYQDKNGKLLTGYIHRSRLKYIATYEEIPATTTDAQKAVFILKNRKIEILSDTFNYKKNKKYFSSTHYGKQQIEDQYKGQQIWGTDGTIPQTHYLSITATIANKKVEIPQKEIENLFNINNENTACYFDNQNETLYITSLNSDGAGGYMVLFIIEKGKYKGRTLIMPF